MTISSMYVRVKREKITYFIQADPSDTILELKEKLQELIDQVRLRCVQRARTLRLALEPERLTNFTRTFSFSAAGGAETLEGRHPARGRQVPRRV